MERKRGKKMKLGGKGEILVFSSFAFKSSKKWMSAILALIFLLSTCSPTYARSGNYGKDSSFEMFAKGALAGFVTAVSCAINPVGGAVGSIAGDITGLVMYYGFYHNQGQTFVKIGPIKITKGQFYSMVASIVASAVTSFVAGAIDGAIDGADGAIDGGSSAAESGVESAATSATASAATSATASALSTTISSILTSILNTIVKIGKEIVEGIVKGIINTVKSIVKRIIKILKGIWKNILKPILKPIWNKVLKPILKPIWNKVLKPILKPIWNKVLKPILKPIWNKFKNIGAKQGPDAFYAYGTQGLWEKALVHLTGDLVIGSVRLYVSEAVKQNLEKRDWDETVASIAGSVVADYVGAFITPVVRQSLGAIASKALGVSGLESLDNSQAGYLSKEEAKQLRDRDEAGKKEKIEVSDTLEIEKDTAGESAKTGEKESVADNKVAPAEGQAAIAKETSAKTPITQETKPADTDKGEDKPAKAKVSLNDLMNAQATVKTKDMEEPIAMEMGEVIEAINKEEITLEDVVGVSVLSEDGKFIHLIEGEELNNAVNNELKSYFKMLEATQTLQDLRGGLLRSPAGKEITEYNLLRGGWETMRSLGLAPLVSAGARVALLKGWVPGLSSLKYYTHYGNDKERIFENLWKMAIANAAGNLAGEVINNWSPLNPWFTGAKDSNNKIVNPWDRSVGMGFLPYIGREIFKEAGGAASQILWGAYAKEHNIDPGVLAEFAHLGGSVLASALIDSGLIPLPFLNSRRDPGNAYAYKVELYEEEAKEYSQENTPMLEVKDKEGKILFSHTPMLEVKDKKGNSHYFKIVELGINDGSEREVVRYVKQEQVGTEQNEEQKFVDGKIYSRDEITREYAKRVITTHHTKLLFIAVHEPDGTFRLKEKDGKLGEGKFIARVTNDIVKIPPVQQSKAQQAIYLAGRLNYNPESVWRFGAATLEDFTNYLFQASIDSALLSFPYRSSGTGLGAFRAHWQVQDKFQQHIEAMMRGSSPIEARTIRLASNLNAWANENFAESISAAMTNPLLKPWLRSYASFIPTQMRLEGPKKLLEEESEQLAKVVETQEAQPVNELLAEREELLAQLKAAEELKRRLEEGRFRIDDTLKKFAHQQHIPGDNQEQKQQRIQERIKQINDEIASIDKEIKNLNLTSQISRPVLQQMAKIIRNTENTNNIKLTPAKVIAYLPQTLAAMKREISELNAKVARMDNYAQDPAGRWGGIVDYTVDRQMVGTGIDLHALKVKIKEEKMGAHGTIKVVEKKVDALEIFKELAKDFGKEGITSAEDTQASLAALKKGKTQGLREVYRASVAGFAQPLEIWVNAPLKVTGFETGAKEGLMPPTHIQRSEAEIKNDIDNLVEYRVKKLKAKGKEVDKEKIREIREQVIREKIEKINQVLPGSQQIDLSGKLDAATVYQAEGALIVNYRRQLGEAGKALTWTQNESQEKKEQVERMLTLLDQPIVFYNHERQLLEETTVDRFGRSQQTTYYGQEFKKGEDKEKGDRSQQTTYYGQGFKKGEGKEKGEWQSVKLPKSTQHYWGSFGRIGSVTTDYSEIKMPKQWPTEVIQPAQDIRSIAWYSPEKLDTLLNNLNLQARREEVLTSRIIKVPEKEFKRILDQVEQGQRKEEIEFLDKVLSERWKTDTRFNPRSVFGVELLLMVENNRDKWEELTLGQKKDLVWRFVGMNSIYDALNAVANNATHNLILPYEDNAEKYNNFVVTLKEIARDLPTWNAMSKEERKAWFENKNIAPAALRALLDFRYPAARQHNVRFSKVENIYIPGIEIKQPAQIETLPLTLGPNITYDLNIYTIDEGTSPYISPTYHILGQDINSGPWLTPDYHYQSYPAAISTKAMTMDSKSLPPTLTEHRIVTEDGTVYPKLDQEVEDYLKTPLARVQEATFSKYRRIESRDYPLPIWSSKGLTHRDDSQRYFELNPYTYDYKQIRQAINQKAVEAKGFNERYYNFLNRLNIITVPDLNLSFVDTGPLADYSAFNFSLRTLRAPEKFKALFPLGLYEGKRKIDIDASSVLPRTEIPDVKAEKAVGPLQIEKEVYIYR